MDSDEPYGWGVACDPALPDVVKLRQRDPRIWEVPCIVVGSWAIHRAVLVDDYCSRHPDPQAWGITHVPSGYSLARWVAEPTFWDAYRIVQALHDSWVFAGDVPAEYSESAVDEQCLMISVIGAALHDHYVWPMNPLTSEAT